MAGLGRCALATGHAAEGRAGLRQAPDMFSRIDAAGASDVSPGTRSCRRYRHQPADIGVIAPAGGLADSPAQVRKLA